MNPSTGIILGVLVPLIGLVAGVVGWAGRRFVAAQDRMVDKVERLDNRLTRVEANQDWSMDTAQATARNTRTAARKVGVLPRNLEQTVERP